MKRALRVFGLVLLIGGGACFHVCCAQTIPPGVGSRQSGAKLANKTSVLSTHMNTAVQTFALEGGEAGTQTSCDDLQDAESLAKFGAAKAVALRAVCSMDTHKYRAEQIADGIKFIDNHINDGDGYADAISGVANPNTDQPAEVIVKEAVNTEPHVDDPNCIAVYNSTTKQFDFKFRNVFPASNNPCGQAGVLAFFNVTKSATFGNTMQYLYNPKVGDSQVSSDLITATFPQGFQLVLSGTGTIPTDQSGTQPAQTTPAASAAQTTSDPVAIAVQKIESGGDFNTRFSFPILSTPPGTTAWSTYLQPSVGIVLGNTSSQSNSSGAQVVYSSSNQYVIVLPVESYFETTSITGDNSNGLSTATLFADVRYGGRVLSPSYAKTVGIPSRVFQLGQASAGVDVAGSFRLGFQYYFGGPRQAYTLATPGGQTSTVDSSIKGFHIVFSYSPKKTS